MEGDERRERSGVVGLENIFKGRDEGEGEDIEWWGMRPREAQDHARLGNRAGQPELRTPLLISLPRESSRSRSGAVPPWRGSRRWRLSSEEHRSTLQCDGGARPRAESKNARARRATSLPVLARSRRGEHV